MAATVMILSAYGLDEELNTVRLYAESILEGMRLGYSPATPLNITHTMAMHEEANALRSASCTIKSFTVISDIIKIKGKMARIGYLK